MRKLRRRNKGEKQIIRKAETTGVKKKSKLYSYDVITNKAVIIKTQTVRFYQNKNKYIEIEPKDDYLVIRSSGEELTRIGFRPIASNQLAVKCEPYSIEKF